MEKLSYQIASRATILLGREGVSRSDGALIELIKNAYDADASFCFVYFDQSHDRIVIIDDSIVRGTTSDRIVRMLREAGAKEVHMRVSSPPFLYPCYFGTDVPARDQLIAYNRSIEE